MARGKKSIDRDEFAGNYTLAFREEVMAVIRAYRERRISKDDLRVYAAQLEVRALHRKSRVDIHRVVNAKRTVCRSLSNGAIRACASKLDSLLAETRQGKRLIVSRAMMCYIAQGRATCTEAIVLLYYSYRRKKQWERRELLREKERYARFRYQELSDESGCARSSLCRAVARLRARGYLQTLAVQKLNENHYGSLFVDGALVSLTPQHGRRVVALPKRTTPSADSDNAGGRFLTTLENKDPKTRNLNRRGPQFQLSEKDGLLVASVVSVSRESDGEFARIRMRAQQITDAFVDAVA